MKEKRKTAATSASASAPASGTNAIALLKADHRKVNALFRRFKTADSPDEKRQLAREVCTELIMHTRLEEEIFYQACREAGVEDEALDEAQVEHDGAKLLIAGLLHDEPASGFYDARMAVLTEYIKHHVGEEEKPGSGIFARARAAKLDMTALGQRLQERKEELMAQADNAEFSPSPPRSLELQSLNFNPEQSTMARQNDRDRDEQGRFTSDDDNSGGRGYSSRGNDDRGYSARDNQRDDRGRFMSDDDRSWGRQGQDRDDDSRYSSRSSDERGRGWYGDSEGHSRASAQGWENRGGSSSRYDNDDDRGGRSYSSNSGQRDEQGRFTSDDDRSGGRSYRDDDSGYGSRGSESRSRNSNGEWSGQSGGGNGNGGYESRGRSQSSRDDYEDRGGNGNRGSSEDRGGHGGHGGWFGDSRGHSEASRRGWQNR